MELYFLRHAQSRGNARGDYSLAGHDQLSARGRRQGRLLLRRLHSFRFDAVYVSPLQRAWETILPFLQQRGQKAEVWCELAETCWQEDRQALPPGRRKKRRHWAPPAAWRALLVCPKPHSLWLPEPETYQEGLGFIRRVRQGLLQKHGKTQDKVLVVGHGHAGGRLLELFLDLPPQGRLEHDNAGLSLLAGGMPRGFKVRFINRVA
ncbi:histidine phosphatase family protein [candidate division FCPU426 bacterium]|nr:histidine phosphatase family protein [candidate division FCPU426 bacterium]